MGDGHCGIPRRSASAAVRKTGSRASRRRAYRLALESAVTGVAPRSSSRSVWSWSCEWEGSPPARRYASATDQAHDHTLQEWLSPCPP